ncbi:hypothetical protein ACLKA6_013512 [Drosophila palustris]
MQPHVIYSAGIGLHSKLRLQHFNLSLQSTGLLGRLFQFLDPELEALEITIQAIQSIMKNRHHVLLGLLHLGGNKVSLLIKTGIDQLHYRRSVANFGLQVSS